MKKKAQCEIVEPSVLYKDSYLSALAEYHTLGKHLDEAVAEIQGDFAQAVQNLKDESQGINMRPGRVPQTTFWIVDADGYVGRISVRHQLNDNLLKTGGHIGYGVRPSKRGQGYGTRALELILPKARALGIEKALLTCDSDNLASKKIIEWGGGVLENEVAGVEGGPSKLRYWIDLFLP